ncbi:hypothetical protein DFH27DRAFT_106307 [Peziza echinospora]|nr:hypothetical protein DFH27DRAFT_106307 [Peziza echinospora]
MLRTNGGRQQLHRKTTNLRYPLSDDVGSSAGPSSSSISLPLAERPGTPNSAAQTSQNNMPGVNYPHSTRSQSNPVEDHPGFQNLRNSGIEGIPDEMDHTLDFGDASDTSFQLYGHSNDSADYSLNGTAGFRETEELDGVAVENMMLREDYGKMVVFLQKNYPEVHSQFISQSHSQPIHEPRSSYLPGNVATQNAAAISNSSFPASISNPPNTTSLQVQLKRKEHDISTLHHQRSQQETELNSLRKQVKGLQDFIIQSRNKTQALEGIVDMDDVYFEREFKQLAAGLKDWCWKLSRGAGLYVGHGDEGDDDGIKGKTRTGVPGGGWSFLNKAEIEKLMKTHSKIGVLTAFVVDRMWKGCWGRYAPGLGDEEDMMLRELEEDMRNSGKISMASINRWRATTISLLSRSPRVAEATNSQTKSLAASITTTLTPLLVSPSSPNVVRPSPADERSLLRILEKAATLYTQLRGQRSRFELVFPGKGERYDCRMMEDSSDIVVYDEEDLMGGTVGAVAFPGVIKFSEEQELERPGGDDGVASAAGAGETVKPRVLVKSRVLCIVPEDPDE